MEMLGTCMERDTLLCTSSTLLASSQLSATVPSPANFFRYATITFRTWYWAKPRRGGSGCARPHRTSVMISASSSSSTMDASRDAVSGADILGICSLLEMREVEGGGVISIQVASRVQPSWSSKSISREHMKRYYQTPPSDTGMESMVLSSYGLHLANHRRRVASLRRTRLHLQPGDAHSLCDGLK